MRYFKLLAVILFSIVNLIVFYLTLQLYQSDQYISSEIYQILKETSSEIKISFIIPSINYTSLSTVSACIPSDYSFSDIEVKEYWPYTTYGKCKTRTNDTITIENNVIMGTCQNGMPVSFYLDNGGMQELGGKVPNISWVTKHKLDLKDAEYVMARCSNESIYSYVFNRFNDSISHKAQNLTGSLSKDKNKPLTVLLLVFDSISRDSARRNLNSSLEFLHGNIANSTRYSFYDFKYANAAAYNTRSNMLRILYGQTEEYHKKFIKLGKPKERKLLLQKDAIWSHYSSLGFVTYFSMDTVFDYVAGFTGRKITSDHTFTNFWKACKSVYGYHDHLERQRCFGDENAHYFSMDHAYQFLENYRNHNRFAYVHITAAHEDSGNIRTVDDDLREFLEKLMRMFDNDEDDFVLFLIGDHGRPNYKLQFKVKGYLERLVAMNYVIMNKELEERINSKKYLESNVERLVGRFDINLSLKWLANTVYGGYDNNQYQLMKEGYFAKDVVSIFSEKINESRTCDDIGVPYASCTCREYTLVNISDSTEKKILNEIISLTTILLYKIYQNETECYSLAEFKIESITKLRISEKIEGDVQIYSLKFSGANSQTFAISANLSTRKNIKKTKQILDEMLHPYKYFILDHIEYFLQVSEISSESGCVEDLITVFSDYNHSII